MPQYDGAQENLSEGNLQVSKYGQSEPQYLLQDQHARPARRSDFAGRNVHRRDKIISFLVMMLVLAVTRVHTPKIIPCRDPGVRSGYGIRSHGKGAVRSRRAVYLVMRFRAMSMEPDILVSHTGM